MNNYEYYKEKIDALWEDNRKIAITINKDTDKIGDCDKTDCSYCLFSVRHSGGDSCKINREKWLVSEYKEPEIDWSKIPVDTPVLVSNDDTNWVRRHFAKVTSLGIIWVYSGGGTSWTADTNPIIGYKYAKLAEVE